MASSNRPGVEITQALAETPVVVASPPLVPVVIGVCNQIIETTDSDGALNADAKYALQQYNQATMYVPQADLPDPRSNIDELTIDESTIGVSLYFGGALRALDRGSNGTYGSAFLKSGNLCRRAALRASVASPYAFDGTAGNPFTLAFDIANSENVSSDITVTLVGTLTAQEVAAALNDAVGATVAEVFNDGADDYLQVESTVFGADSSITVRAGTSALKVLFGSGFDDSLEYRVTGAGFAGQDDQDNDLTTPWIEFARGDYSEDDTAQPSFDASPTANKLYAGQLDLDGEFHTSKAPAVTFTGNSATFPLSAATSTKPGDQMYADGTRVGSGDIIKVEQSRFKVGKLNNTNSTFDDDGQPTNRVYDTVEVSTLSASVPFAPKYAYFVAEGLTFGSITPAGVAATMTGSNQGLAERAAYVRSASDITFPINLASLTLDFTVTEDGIEGDEVTYTFAGGPYANIGDLVTALQAVDELSQLTIGSTPAGNLLLQTTKTGANQAISIKSTGTANTALGFSAVDVTEDTGKDVEFATQVILEGDEVSLPLSFLNGLTAELIVVDSKGTHTLSAVLGAGAGSASTLSGLATVLNTALGSDDGIPAVVFSGPATAYGTLTATSVEGGADVSISITATDATDAFSFLGFYDATRDEPAEVTSTVLTFPVSALDTKTLSILVGPGAVTLDDAMTAASEENAGSAPALAVLLNANPDLTINGTRLLQYIGTGTAQIKIRTLAGGGTASIDVDGSGGSAGLTMGFTDASNDTDTGATSVGNADGTGADGLKSTTLVFNLDDNPHDYSVTFDTNSLQDGIDAINLLVNGSADVASESSRAMTLTSLLAGAASVVLIDEVTSTADDVLGLSGEADGSGRPNPDFYLDAEGAAYIGPNILRNKSSGIPFALESAFASVYIAYTALRRDVTPSATDPSLLAFDTTSDMEAGVGPISTKNPLALGLFLAMANAPSNTVSGLGVDENSAAAPLGTLDGWVRSLEYLESKEVYGLAPLTDDEYVQSLIATHVNSLSQPTERGERIVFIASAIPSRAVTITVSSGEDGQTNGTDDSFTLDKNPNSDLIANGVDPSDTIPVDDALYLELVVTVNGSSELRRYSVEDINGVVLTLRTSFTGSDNVDGFYTTETLSETLTGVDWALKIRGAELLVTGTQIPDRGARATAAGAQATPYGSRRVYYIAADSVDTSINGETQNIEAFYAAAAIVGMVAEQAPQQPFTNLPITGLGRVYGTDDSFSENQLDVITDGGRYVLVNLGGKVVARKQVSTSTTSVEARELSITKAIDWLAKGLRSTSRVFIGRAVITTGFLDQLTLCLTGFLDYAAQLGVVERAKLTSLLQDKTSPDTVLVEVEATPVYPCNKIKITIIS